MITLKTRIVNAKEIENNLVFPSKRFGNFTGYGFSNLTIHRAPFFDSHKLNGDIIILLGRGKKYQ